MLQLGLSVKIETQGRRGTEDKLTQEEVDNAKVIILAHDKNLQGMNRFNGKQIIDTTTKDATLMETINWKTCKNDKTITAKDLTNDDDGSDDFHWKNLHKLKETYLPSFKNVTICCRGYYLGIGFLIDFAAGNGNAGGDFGTVSPVTG